MVSAPTTVQERLSSLGEISLKAGSHNSIADGMCAMELASYLAGEPWSAHPKCVSPVIAAFLRNWNDNLDHEARNRLITPELIAKTIGTKNSRELERKRSLMAADWLIRTHTPAWLRLAKLDKQADLIEALPEITDMAQYPSLRAPLEAIRKDAVAAGDAAWATAGVAARDAARGRRRGRRMGHRRGRLGGHHDRSPNIGRGPYRAHDFCNGGLNEHSQKARSSNPS